MEVITLDELFNFLGVSEHEDTPEEKFIKDKVKIISKQISNIIIKAMSTKNINKKQLAILLNEQEDEIERYLSGTLNFTIADLVRIEQVLGITLLHFNK